MTTTVVGADTGIDEYRLDPSRSSSTSSLDNVECCTRAIRLDLDLRPPSVRAKLGFPGADTGRRPTSVRWERRIGGQKGRGCAGKAFVVASRQGQVIVIRARASGVARDRGAGGRPRQHVRRAASLQKRPMRLHSAPRTHSRAPTPNGSPSTRARMRSRSSRAATSWPTSAGSPGRPPK